MSTERLQPVQHRDHVRSALSEAVRELGQAVTHVGLCEREAVRAHDPDTVIDGIIEAQTRCDRAIEALHRAKRHALHGYPRT